MVLPPHAPVSGGLELLPARPPTPPRETQQRLHAQARPLHPLLNLQTPPGHSPSSLSDSSLPASQRHRKRVGFSGQADYQEPPVYLDKKNASTSKQPTPLSIPPSTTSAKPLKSILKPSPASNPLDPAASAGLDGAPINLATMLESTIKQLAGADRDCKLDAYTMLVRALKASNNLPDRIALQDKMGLFAQFIQRDISTKSPSGVLDSSLVNHALTLLVTFQQFPAIASTLTNDFGVFITDHCIRSFEDASVPKDVVRHLMQVVASQEFSPKVMTADRVGRLIVALHNIENNLKGKSIVMSRIIIYRKLVKQSKLHMLAHSDWLLDLFTDMLSNLKEIRAAAIALGFDTCLVLGKEKQLSKRVLEILSVTVDETKYIEYYIEKLKTMTKDKAESAVVPQVWSVVVLLLRYPIDRWEYFVPLLDIIQKCFNSSDWQTKHEANLAWNRLVYTLQQNESSFFKTLGTVCQPFISQLRRKITGAKQEDLRRTVIGSICNLYYYAFKPNTNATHLDTLWKTCVSPIMSQLVSHDTEAKATEKQAVPSKENITQATILLTGLFDSSTPRVWRDDRVFEKALVKPEELPAIDPKWIRRNAAKIFQVTAPILEVNFLDLSDASSNTSKLWRTIVNAVVAASSKEVKVSSDTALFIGSALSFVLRVWSSGLDDSDMTLHRRFLNAAQHCILTMLSSLGLLPFTEKQLSVSKQNTFVPAATPSHRDSKLHGPAKSPLYHLFWILSTQPPNVLDDEHMYALIKAVLSPFFASRPMLARRDLASDLMQSLPSDAHTTSASWQFVSEVLVTALGDSQASHSSMSSSGAPTVGHEYRSIVKHLERGLVATPNLQWPVWQSLFAAVTDRAEEEAGVAACAMAAIEPLAKVVAEGVSEASETLPDLLANVGCELISRSAQPRDRQSLDAARRRLWGTLAAGARSTSFDPFDNLYRLMNNLLLCLYDKSGKASTEDLTPRVVSEVARFLARANTQLAPSTLVALQPGISRWLQDADNRYDSKQATPLSDAVQNLWERACSILNGAEGFRQVALASVEPMLCAVFQSNHRNYVLSAVAMWNEAFENADAIEYPEKLETVLRGLQPYVDIILPGLQASDQAGAMQEPKFLDSQHDIDNADIPVASAVPSSMEVSSDVLNHGKPSSRPSSPAELVRLSFPATRSGNVTPRRSLRRRSGRHDIAARLRHDDSQIHFAAIESSSPNHDTESQHLTERQQEVRERQRDTSALFPELRSSTSEDIELQDAEPRLPVPDSDHPEPEQAATPEANQAFNDLVSSTPTPRRGQTALVIVDQYELDEVPSSPPEPRRNLLREMRTRSRSSSSIMDDFQFSSSPVSESPTMNRPIPARESISEPSRVESASHAWKPTEIVSPPKQSPSRLSTPPNRRRTRSRKESPRSDNDNEVFVDALTSPQRKSPRGPGVVAPEQKGVVADGIATRSFELSEGEERSMARLIVELDSRKCDPTPNIDSPSPAKLNLRRKGPVVECITVQGGHEGEATTPRRSPRHGQAPVATIPSTPVDVGSSQNSVRRSRRKRKRATEVADSTQKKRKHQAAGEAAVETVLDSQVDLEACSSTASQDASPSANITNERITRQESQELGMPASSAPLFFRDDVGAQSMSDTDSAHADSSDISETEAVNSQLLAEASQDSYGSRSGKHRAREGMVRIKDEPGQYETRPISADEATGDADMIDAPDTGLASGASVERAPAAAIMASLRAGLCALQTAELSRREVYQIEDMFMDIKKALYAAEERSRSSR
ncbi:Rap1-interacting factor 1 N terminal-domain-containing protein [Microdochium bolleyi]|uniref:Rap1-interacting factor 1 N terminal-domain-containing protein n=1 Tax=Microdochium bolleyi TaxID=196109 RepID=A0A136IN21_9PEZI|nr:Rap1-interacting factor 1 N terminal-domain-containing protein [Microdochium bolleyi]